MQLVVKHFVFVITLLAFMLPQARQASAQAEGPDFSALEKVALEELKATNTPGAAIAIVMGDRMVYARGFGVASIDTGAPVTPEMLFRLGSTTKMITAAALVTLAEQGKVRLDAPTGNYVKSINPKLAQVTSHQLLSNTSGLRDFAATLMSQEDAGLGNSIRAWKEDVFFTEPGKIYSYSSPGFWLAGLVIEEASGRAYADAMEEVLFKPLGMRRTTLRPLMAMTWPMAMGHSVAGGSNPAVIRPFFNNTAMWPAGSVFSNVLDLSRFVIALMNGGRLEGKQTLAASVAAKLPAPHVALPGAPDVSYGYGLLSYPYRGVQVVTHGGASRGYGSTFQMVPEHRFAIIVLTNKSGETLARTREKAMELALPLKPQAEEKPGAPPPISDAEMAKYAGTYAHQPQLWEIYVKDGRLYLKQDGVESQLTKTGDYKFSFGTSGENEIVLVPGAGGKIEYLFTGLYAAKKVK